MIRLSIISSPFFQNMFYFLLRSKVVTNFKWIDKFHANFPSYSFVNSLQLTNLNLSLSKLEGGANEEIPDRTMQNQVVVNNNVE